MSVAGPREARLLIAGNRFTIRIRHCTGAAAQFQERCGQIALACFWRDGRKTDAPDLGKYRERREYESLI